MDEIYSKAIEYSNISQALAIQKKNLKEQIDARLTYGHNGGIFKIDQSLITFIHFLISKGRTEEVVILDTNNNPILIKNLLDFSDEILDRYMSSLYEYYTEYERLKKARTLEKIIQL